MLLVHGLASSFEHNWRQPGWVDLLGEAGRTVLGVDLLGHGRADRPTDPAAYVQLEQNVLAAIDGRVPVDAVGFSLGARLLLTLAAADADRFRRLVVIGVGANLFRDDDPEIMASALEAGPSAEDVTAQLFARLAASAGNDPAALAACLRRRFPPLGTDELSRVRCPVLVVIGDRDFAGPADPLVEALPDARLLTLRRVDHFSAPNDFGCIDAVLEFLDSVPP